MKMFLGTLIVLIAMGSLASADIQVKDGLVSANIQSESLNSVLTALSDQTGLDIALDSSAANEMVYANFENLPIGQAIRKLLEGTDINFAMVEGAGQTPTSLFVSKSAAPGAPPKRLDTRPVNTAPNRGVVTPVQPMPPQPVTSLPPQQQGNPRDEKDPNQARQPAAPPQVPTGGSSVPTGGSLNPTYNPNPQNPNQPNQKPDMQNVVNEDDEDDEDEDE